MTHDYEAVDCDDAGDPDMSATAVIARVGADANTIMSGSPVVRFGMRLQAIAVQLGAIATQLIADEVEAGWTVCNKPEVVETLVLSVRRQAMASPVSVEQLRSDIVTQVVPGLDVILNKVPSEQVEHA